jgi:hypothetical protein
VVAVAAARDHKVPKVPQVHKEKLAQQVQLEVLEHKVQQAQKEIQEMMGILDRLARRVPQVLLELMARPAPLDQQVQQDSKEA